MGGWGGGGGGVGPASDQGGSDKVLAFQNTYSGKGSVHAPYLCI